MTDDDDFAFGEDTGDDETTLFGASSAESEGETAGERRFGTAASDSTDSRSFSRRVRDAVSDDRVRIVVTAGMAVVLVVALGLVAYPFVIGALDAPDPAEADAPAAGSAGVGTHTTAIQPATTVQTTTPAPTAPASTMAESTARKTQSATPTPTPTPIPSRAFPAGTPVETNGTTAVRSARSSVQSAA